MNLMITTLIGVVIGVVLYRIRHRFIDTTEEVI